MMKPFRVFPIAVLLSLVCTAAPLCITGCDDDDSPSTDAHQVGVLVPLTGEVSDLGESIRAAVELAAQEINDQALNTRHRIELTIHDTESLPPTAAYNLNNLYDDGIRLVIGPCTSEEVSLIKTIADQNNMLMISGSATTAGLAVTGDSLMRFVVDDTAQAEVLSDKLLQDGISKIAVFYRPDIYGQGLADALAEAFTTVGGSVIAEYSYSRGGDQELFQTQLAELQIVVENEQSAEPADEIGVVVVFFQEGITLLHEADAFETLDTLKWFGTDSLAKNNLLLADSQAAAFAARTGLRCSSMAAFTNDAYTAVEAQLQAQLGKDISVFAMIYYDAVHILSQALEQVGEADVEALKEKIREVVTEYQGATGPFELNNADDRTGPKKFDFWTVTDQDGSYGWSLESTLESSLNEDAGFRRYPQSLLSA